MDKRFAVLLCLVANIVFAQNNLTGEELKITPLISGTLLQPENTSKKLAIIIPGSGPTDRNGNQQTAQNNSLKLLAEALTKNGIATFRYDKRLIALLRKNDLREEDINFDDFVDDAVNVIMFFQEQGFEDITLIGHSQGALVAQLASNRAAISRMVILAGAGLSIDEIIVTQLQTQAPALAEEAAKAFDSLEIHGKVEKFSPGLFSIFRPSVQPFIKSWMQYDPAELLKESEVPTLIVSGSKDLQITPEDIQMLNQARPDIKSIEIEDMNHVLKEIKGDELENSKSYNEPYRPIIPQVVDVITEFILK